MSAPDLRRALAAHTEEEIAEAIAALCPRAALRGRAARPKRHCPRYRSELEALGRETGEPLDVVPA